MLKKRVVTAKSSSGSHANSKTKRNSVGNPAMERFLRPARSRQRCRDVSSISQRIRWKITKTREDIHTWADVLDLDDYVSFWRKA